MTVSRADTGFSETGERVPLAWPSVFAPRENLSPSDARRAEIRRAALAVIIGADLRPLAEIGRAIGCSRQALSESVHAVAAAVGLDCYFKGADARRKFREAAQRAWQTRRAKGDGV